jgi:thermostable 8-oxoguanine DNA glycosylase
MEEDEIREYLKHYDETQGVLPEKIQEFGEKFQEQGHLTQEQLYQIAYESSTRSAYHVRKNPEEICREVTSHILEIKDDFSQIALVSALKGFKAPTASCVLTAKDPERHAIVDTRVWASLERYDRVEGRKESFDAFDYVEMIEEIREIASGTEFSTAEVGYALFAHDVEHREGTLH